MSNTGGSKRESKRKQANITVEGTEALLQNVEKMQETFVGTAIARTSWALKIVSVRKTFDAQKTQLDIANQGGDSKKIGLANARMREVIVRVQDLNKSYVQARKSARRELNAHNDAADLIASSQQEIEPQDFQRESEPPAAPGNLPTWAASKPISSSSSIDDREVADDEVASGDINAVTSGSKQNLTELTGSQQVSPSEVLDPAAAHQDGSMLSKDTSTSENSVEMRQNGITTEPTAEQAKMPPSPKGPSSTTKIAIGVVALALGGGAAVGVYEATKVMGYGVGAGVATCLLVGVLAAYLCQRQTTQSVSTDADDTNKNGITASPSTQQFN